MPTIRTQTIRHFFGGGWSTDYGPTVDVSPDQSGKVTIPFLVDAENCLFELDGGPHKVGGTSLVNASPVASGAPVNGVYDYWRQGAAGSPARKRVIHAGTVCMSDNDDGTFVNLFTGLTAGAVPSYSTFDDLLIIASDAIADVPKQWDQTTAQNLAGTPPRFSFSCMHKNRQWAAGVQANPSRLYYSINVDPTDWVGVGSGSIDIDISDGDIITGLASHRNDLWVFKGPNKGSIHRITGSSPTGSDGFARTTFVRGLGAAWHNAIFPFGDDLGFVSQFGSVHSLSAVNAYGDFVEGALSRPINIGWIRGHLNYNRLRNIWAINDPLNSLVYFTASWDSSTTNNAVLVMDYRNAPDRIRWSKIPAYAAASLGLFVDSNGIRRVLAGGNDGYVRRLNISDRAIDGSTAISYRVTTPYMNYGAPQTMKTLERGSIGIAPKGAFTGTFGWTRDLNAQQTQTFTQTSGDVLGPSTNQFTLGTSTLGGTQYIDRYFECEGGGEARAFQYQITDSTVSHDLEVHSFSTSLHVDADSSENA